MNVISEFWWRKRQQQMTVDIGVARLKPLHSTDAMRHENVIAARSRRLHVYGLYVPISEEQPSQG